MTIKLTEAQRIKVFRPDDLFDIMQGILLKEEKNDQNREHFWVVGLESNNRILFIELISLGSINKTVVEPMEVFSLAVQKRAVSIILVHNHPSGSLEFSPEDIEITDRLLQVGKIIKIPVKDHLLISAKSYVSCNAIGLLGKIAQSLSFVTSYDLAAAYLQEGEMNGRMKVATLMKKHKVDNNEITKLTGLPVEEVKGIRVAVKVNEGGKEMPEKDAG